MPKFVVGVQYLNTPERAPAAVDLLDSIPPEIEVYFHGSEVKEPIFMWSERLWRETLALADRNGATHCLFIQEDVELCKGFWEAIQGMVEARPNDIVSLHSPHWIFGELYARGFSWAVSWDGLTGNAYWLPVDVLRDILKFRAEDMKTDAVAYHSEDGLIGTYAMCKRLPIMHPLPSPIDHLHLGESLYDHDKNLYYRPVVRRNAGLDWHDWSKEPAVLGLIYNGEHWRLRQYLKPEAVRKYRVIEHMYELERVSKNPGVNPDDVPEADT